MSALAAGQSLSERFTLIRPLGKGGMSEVWLVRDEVLDEQLVAKILPPGAPEDRVALLRRECRNVRRLVHPAIVPVFDFRRSGGYHFITMAHVEGQELGALRGRPPVEIVSVALRIADAVAYAHELGIVHRDLKTSNVICDANGQPHLLDFGIAGVLDDGPDGGVRGGGSRYSVSPQQLAGAEPTTSDDVYAFGVMLYELVSGKPPFWPDPTEARVRTEVPPPPESTHAVPPKLVELIGAMLAKEPAERPSSMAEVVSALQEIDGELSTLTVPPTQRSRPGVRLTPPPKVRPIRPIRPTATPPAVDDGRRRRGRRSWLWAGATVVVASLFGVGAFFLMPYLTEALEASRQAAVPDQAAAGLNERPSAVEPEADPPSQDDGQPPQIPPRQAIRLERQAEESLDRAVRLMEGLESKGVTYWAEEEYRAAEALVAKGDDHLTAREFQDALGAYDEGVRRLEELDGRSIEVIQEALNEGNRALEEGDAAAASAAFELVLHVAPSNQTAAKGLERTQVLDELVGLLDSGSNSERAGNLVQAEQAYRRAVALDPLSRSARTALARVEGRLSEDAFARLMSEGLAALNSGDYEAALAALHEADGLRPGSPEVADGLAQAEEALKLEQISRHRGKAADLEAGEQWREAAEQYDEVLKLDPTIRFALEGKDRCLKRAALAERIEFQLTHPQRLSADAVYAEALDLLDEASGVEPAGPRHRDQVARLDALLEIAGTRVSVWLESDDETEVTVYKVGRLGTFIRRELTLRPGTYTVVGTRRGYRDVRKQLVVKPDSPVEPLVIRCEEKI